MDWKIQFMGTRGSVPVTEKNFQKYGGDTLCVRIQAGEDVLLIDGGTGIRFADSLPSKTTLLIGHPHFDHLIGLGLWPALSSKEQEVDIYMARYNGQSAEEVLAHLYSPPLWPVTLHQFPAQVRIHDWKPPLTIGRLRIDSIEGNHPGGVTHFRITDGCRTIIYAIDCELTASSAAKLSEFAKNCDLLLIDGQLSESNIPAKLGWGHNVGLHAARFGRDCGAKQTVLLHFDPAHTDHYLDTLAQNLADEKLSCILGRQGDILTL